MCQREHLYTIPLTGHWLAELQVVKNYNLLHLIIFVDFCQKGGFQRNIVFDCVWFDVANTGSRNFAAAASHASVAFLQKDQLVIKIADGKKKLQELEDEILRLLNEAQGSLLDDEQLVNTLHSSKTISAEVSEQLQVSEQTEIKIDAAREVRPSLAKFRLLCACSCVVVLRNMIVPFIICVCIDDASFFQGYRSCAQRASILFFVLNDMGRIDPMYQFSLDSFIDLFNQSIDKSQKSSKLEERITNLNEYHTYAVYR